MSRDKQSKPQRDPETSVPATSESVCGRCGGLQYLTSAEHEFATARVCDCAAVCAECGGEGHRAERDRDGYLIVRPCGCASVHDRVARFNAVRLPPRYADKTLENFAHFGGNQNKLKYLLLNYRKHFELGQRGVLLMGRPGTGKTHLLAALLSFWSIERGINCRYIDFMSLLSELKEGYNQGKTEAAILGPLLAFEVLAVDELGKGRSTEWEAAILDELISRRYNTRRTTLFATNYGEETTSPTTSLAEADQTRALYHQLTLEDRVGPRIYSRLRDMCDFHVVTGPDYRLRP